MPTPIAKAPPEILAALQTDAPVAVGVSGGKDSGAVALATQTLLNELEHQGPKILIHADLGLIEWQDSLPTCERLAKHMGWELVVVKRKTGDMIDRWEQRWKNNLERWSAMEVAKLILPWSTPGMRFCTSELKTQVIAQDLVKRWPGQTIINITGIRAEESANRAAQPICKPSTLLTRTRASTTGLDWHPIHHWTTTEVFQYLADNHQQLHEAYRIYKSSRVSCSFCIMSSLNDLKAAIQCPTNEAAWRRLVALEFSSTFQFQTGRWLASLAPEKLTPAEQQDWETAKAQAHQRDQIAKQFPKGLELRNGVATQLPTNEQALQIAKYRAETGILFGIKPDFTTAETVQTAYQNRLGTPPLETLVQDSQTELALCS